MLAMKANHQLVLTGQYVQSVCPITGRDISEDKTVEIGGVTVGLCCAGCLKKVDKQEGLAAKAQLVFADKPFEKGFERKIEEVNLAELNCLFQDQKDVNPDMFAEYNGHRVYFCCPECKADFEKDPSAHTAEANHQLAESGQVKQVACPFSGGDVAENQSSEIDGVTVKFCCKNCKAKMDQADEEQQMEYAFGEKGFKRAFAKNE